MKEIQDDTSRQIHIPCSWIGRKKYCQNEYTTTAIYRCSEIPIKSPITFFTELGQKKILKICMETQRPCIAKETLRKNNGAEGISFLEFRL